MHDQTMGHTRPHQKVASAHGSCASTPKGVQRARRHSSGLCVVNQTRVSLIYLEEIIDPVLLVHMGGWLSQSGLYMDAYMERRQGAWVGLVKSLAYPCVSET